MVAEIRINSKEIEQALGEVMGKIAHPAQLMESIGTALSSVTAQNFQAQGRPKWLGLQRPGEKRKGGMILQDSGRLRDSVVASHTDNSVTIGTNVVYAAIHQFGGQTKAHTILPKNGKALKFNGRFAKKVNHPGSKIPARPFLPMTKDGELQPEATIAIESVVQIYLNSLGVG